MGINIEDLAKDIFKPLTLSEKALFTDTINALMEQALKLEAEKVFRETRASLPCVFCNAVDSYHASRVFNTVGVSMVCSVCGGVISSLPVDREEKLSSREEIKNENK